MVWVDEAFQSGFGSGPGLPEIRISSLEQASLCLMFSDQTAAAPAAACLYLFLTDIGETVVTS